MVSPLAAVLSLTSLRTSLRRHSEMLGFYLVSKMRISRPIGHTAHRLRSGLQAKHWIPGMILLAMAAAAFALDIIFSRFGVLQKDFRF